MLIFEPLFNVHELEAKMTREDPVNVPILAPEPTNQLFKQDYPAYLKLLQVQIVHRHGERTPTGNYLPSFVNKYWTLCQLSSLFHANVIGYEARHKHSQFHPSEELPPQESTYSVDIPQIKSVPGVSEANLKSVGSLQKRIEEVGHFHAGMHRNGHEGQACSPSIPQGTCFFGQLTDKGRETHFQLGSSLRRLYIDKLQLIPSMWTGAVENQLYVRTTDYPRTLESVQHLMAGLYPVKFRSKDESPVVYTRFHADETLFGDSKCSRWRQLLKNFAQQYRTSHAKEIADMQKSHKALASDTSNLHAIYDTLVALKAHNLKMPHGETDEQIMKLERHANSLWFKLYHDSQNGDEATRLCLGRFLQEVKDVMEWRLNQKQEELKFAVYSTHDSTVGPLLGALKLDSNRWPAFASNVLFELIEDTNRNQLYVRTKYNGETQKLPFCTSPDKHHPKHNELCTYEAFWQRLNTLIPKDYKNECNMQPTDAEEED